MGRYVYYWLHTYVSVYDTKYFGLFLHNAFGQVQI
jgi:hypothetical protein